MKCNRCGLENTEFARFVYAPATTFGKAVKWFFGSKIKINVCQTCVSKMFRKLDKEV